MSLWVYMSISYIHIQWRCDSRILFDHIRLLLIAYYRVEEQCDICEEKKNDTFTFYGDEGKHVLIE